MFHYRLKMSWAHQDVCECVEALLILCSLQAEETMCFLQDIRQDTNHLEMIVMPLQIEYTSSAPLFPILFMMLQIEPCMRPTAKWVLDALPLFFILCLTSLLEDGSISCCLKEAESRLLILVPWQIELLKKWKIWCSFKNVRSDRCECPFFEELHYKIMLYTILQAINLKPKHGLLNMSSFNSRFEVNCVSSVEKNPVFKVVLGF